MLWSGNVMQWYLNPTGILCTLADINNSEVSRQAGSVPGLLWLRFNAAMECDTVRHWSYSVRTFRVQACLR